MIKKNQRFFNWQNRILDMIILCLSYILAIVFWIFLLDNDKGNVSILIAKEHWLFLILLSFIDVVIFQYGGLYNSLRFKTVWKEIGRLIICHTLFTIFVIGLIFVFKLNDFSRGVIASFYVISCVLLIIKRIIVKLILRFIRKKGLNQKHILIVGDGKIAEKFINNVNANPQFGLQLIGYVGKNEKIDYLKHLGAYNSFAKIMDGIKVDEVIIALDKYNETIMTNILNTCEKCGTRANVIPVYNEYLSSCAIIDSIGDIRFISIRGISQDIFFYQLIKRFFDLLFSLVVIILISPILLIISIGVKLSSPGPVLFKQKRVGKEGKIFTMYKFRSMKINNDSDTTWSKDQDSRVTKFGAFLRKFSLDELPQFFNVIKGDMSVVGPRPELPFFVEQYQNTVPRYMVKHQVKPGVTGWAQINGFRGDTSIEERIHYDIWYIENWSMFLDIKIILRTVFGGMINSEKNLERKKETQK